MDWPLRLAKTGILIEMLISMGCQTVFDAADFVSGILVEIIAEFRGHLMAWPNMHFQTEFWSKFLNYLIGITWSSEDLDSCAWDLKPSRNWIWKKILTWLGNMY